MNIQDNHLLSGDGIIHMSCPKNTKKFGVGLPDTIVIHYTAGRSAESSAKYLCRDGIKASAHIVIGRQGEIYQMVPFDTISWHAGRSKYGGRVGLNGYSIGIELDNAGPLKKVGSEYTAWFGAKYQANDVLHATHRNEQSPRYWHTYTDKQIEACRELCEALVAKYKMNTIVGHEEISPGRKQDPGPAFPLDRFRTHLLSQNRSDDEEEINKPGLVDANFLNIRDGAGVSNKKVAQALQRGTEVQVIEEENGWYKVETKITGWVSKGHIKLK